MVGGQPTEGELKQLAANGFKTIAKLRTEGEEDQPFSPEPEVAKVPELRMG